MWPIRFCILVLAAVPLIAQHEYTAADLENGGRLYDANCARCHGPDGDALGTADVGHGKFRRASSDAELIRLIINGIPDTPMAAANNISEQQAGTIVAYLRDMAAAAARRAATPGDANRGKSIFEAAKGGCTGCHRVNGTGSRVGPDLSDVGQLRRAADLERSVLEPDATIAPNQRAYKVVTRDGVTHTGRLLNRDSFSVQLLDSKEQLRSFSISNVREHGFVDKSPMPSYRDKLTSQELADVVSYLVSLKGQAAR
jgi:putative heme-binding domain-containing protein